MCQLMYRLPGRQTTCLRQGSHVLPASRCMPRGDVTLQREQLLSDAGCLPVQYKEGVYSLVKQAQLVGHPLDPCTGVKSSP